MAENKRDKSYRHSTRTIAHIQYTTEITTNYTGLLPHPDAPATERQMAVSLESTKYISVNATNWL